MSFSARPRAPRKVASSRLRPNIYLHHVLDEWFERDVRVRLKGNSILVRYADDSVMALSSPTTPKRVMDVLGRRLARYGLTLHPDKTHLVDFRFHRPGGDSHPRIRTASRSTSSASPISGPSQRRG